MRLKLCFSIEFTELASGLGQRNGPCDRYIERPQALGDGNPNAMVGSLVNVRGHAMAFPTQHQSISRLEYKVRMAHV